jgi:hypothetical protein
MLQGRKVGEKNVIRKRAIADEALASFVSTAIAEESASASAASSSTRFSKGEWGVRQAVGLLGSCSTRRQ